MNTVPLCKEIASLCPTLSKSLFACNIYNNSIYGFVIKWNSKNLMRISSIIATLLDWKRHFPAVIAKSVRKKKYETHTQREKAIEREIEYNWMLLFVLMLFETINWYTDLLWNCRKYSAKWSDKLLDLIQVVWHCKASNQSKCLRMVAMAMKQSTVSYQWVLSIWT